MIKYINNGVENFRQTLKEMDLINEPSGSQIIYGFLIFTKKHNSWGITKGSQFESSDKHTLLGEANINGYDITNYNNIFRDNDEHEMIGIFYNELWRQAKLKRKERNNKMNEEEIKSKIKAKDYEVKNLRYQLSKAEAELSDLEDEAKKFQINFKQSKQCKFCKDSKNGECLRFGFYRVSEHVCDYFEDGTEEKIKQGVIM